MCFSWGRRPWCVSMDRPSSFYRIFFRGRRNASEMQDFAPMTRPLAILPAALALACSAEPAPVVIQKPIPVAPAPPASSPPLPPDPVAEAMAIAAAGLDMGPSRLGSSLRDVDAARACGIAMRTNRARVDALRAALGDDARSARAKPYVFKLYDCVSCMPAGAEDACAEVRVALDRK